MPDPMVTLPSAEHQCSLASTTLYCWLKLRIHFTSGYENEIFCCNFSYCDGSFLSKKMYFTIKCDIFQSTELVDKSHSGRSIITILKKLMTLHYVSTVIVADRGKSFQVNGDSKTPWVERTTSQSRVRCLIRYITNQTFCMSLIISHYYEPPHLTNGTLDSSSLTQPIKKSTDKNE